MEPGLSDRVERTIILASSAELSAQGLAFNVVARNSILNDKNFNNGNYYETSFLTKAQL